MILTTLVEGLWLRRAGYLKVRVPVSHPDISNLGLGIPAFMLLAVGTERDLMACWGLGGDQGSESQGFLLLTDLTVNRLPSRLCQL